MVQPKVIIGGPQRVDDQPPSGRSALVKALISNKFTTDYIGTIGAAFEILKINLGYPPKCETDNRVALWDLTGEPRYSSLIRMYLSQSHMLLYCVDLTQAIDIEQMKKDVNEFKRLNKSAKVILVGTKSDHIQASKECFEQIDIEKLGIDFRVVTSAKTREGLDTLIGIITNHAIHLSPSQPVIRKENKETKQTVPLSYRNMWQAGMQKGAEPHLGIYEGALALLKDYCKTDSYGESPFYSAVKLFFTRHWFRHHLSTVRDLVNAFDNPSSKEEKTVRNLLGNLKIALEEKLKKGKKPIITDGSLARRIAYIQQQAFGDDRSKDIINIDELNANIAQSPTASNVNSI